MSKSMAKLYKEDALYRVVFDMVEGDIRVGKVISTKINKLMSKYGKSSATFELYALLKLNEIDKKYDPARGNRLETFVKTCLNNILVSDYRRGKIREIYLTQEEDDINIDNNLDNSINSDEIIDLFKEFYGEDLINILLEGTKLVNDYTLAETLWAIGQGGEYNSIYKRLRRSKPKFEEFLSTKGIELVETEYGMYFNYK